MHSSHSISLPMSTLIALADLLYVKLIDLCRFPAHKPVLVVTDSVELMPFYDCIRQLPSVKVSDTQGLNE